jgi:hypothetical protein
MFPQREPILEKLSPPLVVDASVLSQLRARETALARVPKWNPPLKAIVVPGAMVGEQAGIVVYVVRLGATKDDLALGMHYRALLSSDGTTLQNIEPLSDVSDVTHVNGSEGGLPGMSNFRLGHPSEADVLTSLRHPNLEFMVVSEHVRWMVFHGSIGAQKEPPEPALVDALKDALRTIANRNHMPLDALPADPR